MPIMTQTSNPSTTQRIVAKMLFDAARSERDRINTLFNLGQASIVDALRAESNYKEKKELLRELTVS